MKGRVLQKWLAAAILIAVALTVTSCGNSIVGSWTNTSFGLATTISFHSDGTLSVSALGVSVAAGTYRVSGNQLVLSASEGLLGAGLSSGASTFRISGNQLILDGLVFLKD